MSHERFRPRRSFQADLTQVEDDTLGCGCHHFDVPFRLGTPRSPAGCLGTTGCYRTDVALGSERYLALSAWAFQASHLRPSPKANANGAWGCGIDKPLLLDRFSTP